MSCEERPRYLVEREDSRTTALTSCGLDAGFPYGGTCGSARILCSMKTVEAGEPVNITGGSRFNG